MQQILIAQAGADMVLAKDVETAEGRVLCGKGTVLNACLIDRLRKMEVTHITVEGHPVKEGNELTLSEELQAIEDRFRRVKHIPPLMHLKKRIQERTIAARKE